MVPFLSMWDSLSPLLWKLSLGVFLRFLHFHHFKGTLFYNPYLHFQGWTRRVRVRIRLYESIQLLDGVRICPCLLHVQIADCIKNGGPYRCLSLTRIFLASKTSLSIADHLQAIFINRSTCQAYIETLKMPLTHKQPKKWWTNRQTNKQTHRQTKHSTPAAHAHARGNNWGEPERA